MGEQISIRLKFVFESKDQTKALKLHKLLKQFGAVSNVVHMDSDTSLNKDDRLNAILNIMNPNGTYTTGALWKRYAPICKTGQKTFQRDLNTLIIEGKIEGIKTRIRGSTTMWSRTDGK
jgi:hypothetical protein